MTARAAMRSICPRFVRENPMRENNHADWE